MFNNILFTIEVFVFIFCSLNIFKHLYNMVKIMRTRDGKLDNGSLSTILLGLSISYVLTVLITGF
jgi:hypothetical protein